MKTRMIFSNIIDLFIIGFVVATVTMIFGSFSFELVRFDSNGIVIKIIPIVSFLVYAIVIFGALSVLYALKDLTFKNASIGMKIMGLMVLDKDFNIPDKKLLIKRGFRMFFQRDLEFALYKNKEHYVIKWEYNRFGTITVNKKSFLNDKTNYIKALQEVLNSDIRY